MDDYNIIIKPLVTEQGMHFANTKSAYSFEVNKRANKTQIKNAVERIYNVKVQKVRTANRKGKQRRKGRTIGTTASWKKAVVFLDPDFHIDLF
ncbi:MAG: 50S ribosomal protein L23 [Planctomycetaceae bacterium]|nr:MAG: 50S ribosomal protein L23 [Planctomycetaceae bacterium]